MNDYLFDYIYRVEKTEDTIMNQEIEKNGVTGTEKSFRERAKELVALMTLEEKAGLCSGKDCWTLKAIERLGLESIMVSDGPHGLRKQLGATDNLGIGDSLPSVCFPTASAMACSFDPELAWEVGKAIGEECLQEEVSVILGPGANQKRSPLCGRNFEYYSEDPLVSGEMAAAMIQGVQSTGIGTSLKHFAVNNQERRRMTVNAVVDERALRETYLKAFEIAVKKGRPQTVMCAYNRLNGEYCSEKEELLTKILREEWGFEGLVVSDWGAVNDRSLGVLAGMDLEMPGSMGINDTKLVAAVKNGALSEEKLNQSAIRVTELILRHMETKRKDYHYSVEEHHDLAVKASVQSAVLLKNVDNILPGKLDKKAAVIGAFAKTPRYQGAGSSKLHPIRIENAFDTMTEMGLNITYADGYYLGGHNTDKEAELIAKACEAARGKDVVYLFAGLPEGYESEGYDRTSMELPELHNRLICAVAECNPNVVVILHGGAAMELPWYDKVKGILLVYLSGEGGGRAVAELLLGNAVPCGKLAETWPLQLADNPSYHYFPGGRNSVEYRESIYVGYRYYEKSEKPVRFPFGHGLSYTNFSYSDLQVSKDSCELGEVLDITFTITNCGNYKAKETAFLFVGHDNEKVFMPKKELRAFRKLELAPGESRSVTISLSTGDFSYYNTMIGDWYAESGAYEISIGASSVDIRLNKTVILSSPEKPQPDLREKAPSYYKLTNEEFRISDQEFEVLYGKPLPVHDDEPKRPYDHNNTLEDIQHTLTGRLILKFVDRLTKKVTKESEEEEAMMSNMIKEMPFHSLVASGEGMVSEAMLEGLLQFMNGHPIKAVKALLKS
jgi:beta-glucosidase